MTEYRLLAEPRVDLDVAATFTRYETEQAGLGQEFLDELRATYDRVADGPPRTSTSGQESVEPWYTVSRTLCTPPSRPMRLWCSPYFT